MNASPVDLAKHLHTWALFADIPIQQLEWLVANSSLRLFARGEYIFQRDYPIDYLNIVLRGQIDVIITQDSQSQKLLSIIKAGEVTGLLPYSRAKIATNHGIAHEECELLSLHRDLMPTLIKENYELTQALVHQMSSRIRDYTQQMVLNDKMAALGKLSAGLAHELGNPISAIVRSADFLKKHLQLLPDNFKQVIKIRLPEATIDQINGLLFQRIATHTPFAGNLLERHDLHEQLTEIILEYLAEYGDAHDIAHHLLDYGFGIEEVRQIIELSTPAFAPAILKWVNDNLVTQNMVEDISQASQRVSTLINSIKSYAYLDQSQDFQEVDIHAGIRNTLVVLNHKIQSLGASIELKLDERANILKGLPGELNQVWTNLIDNALDAVVGAAQPKIEIETLRYGNHIKVYVRDNGVGIAPEHQTKIFDPFFTTKPVGKGTGLGLDIVQKIAHQHNATIEVQSQPGNTQIMVCFNL